MPHRMPQSIQLLTASAVLFIENSEPTRARASTLRHNKRRFFGIGNLAEESTF